MYWHIAIHTYTHTNAHLRKQSFFRTRTHPYIQIHTSIERQKYMAALASTKKGKAQRKW